MSWPGLLVALRRQAAFMGVPMGTLCSLGSFQLPCIIIMTFSLMSCPGVSKLYLLGCSYWTMTV